MTASGGDEGGQPRIRFVCDVHHGRIIFLAVYSFMQMDAYSLHPSIVAKGRWRKQRSPWLRWKEEK